MLNSNYTKHINKKLHILGAVALAGGMVSHASADISYTISNASLEDVTINYNNGGNQTVLAGGIGITAVGPTTGGAPSSYVSLCSDFNGTLYLGDTYTYASPVSTTTVPNNNYSVGWQTTGADAIQNAATLFANYSSVLVAGKNYDQAAGLQLAIWTVLYDSNGVGKISAGGPFQAVDTTPGPNAYSWMTTYLNSLGGLTPSTSVDILLPTSSELNASNNSNGDLAQSLLYTPVPEASTVVTGALLLLSFGMCSLKSFGKHRA